LADLTLLRGIGGRTRDVLKERGWDTIRGLLGHRRYQAEATHFLELLERGEAVRVINWLRRWRPPSDPLLFHCSSLHHPGGMVVMDIETLRLAVDRPVILIGVGRSSDGSLKIYQYLARHAGEEAAVLRAFLSQMDRDSFLVTFNGQSFDVPFPKGRLAHWGMRGLPELPHHDLLPFVRRAWGGTWPTAACPLWRSTCSVSKGTGMCRGS